MALLRKVNFSDIEARVLAKMAENQNYLRMSSAYSDWLEASGVYRRLRNASPEELRAAEERMEELWAKYLLIRG